MSYTNPNNYAYGLTQGPLLNIFTPPQVALFNPEAKNKAQLGTIWINKSSNNAFILTSYINGVPNWMPIGLTEFGSGTDGQVLIAATSGIPKFASMIAGANITLTAGPNSLTIAATGGGSAGLTWGAVTTDAAFTVNQGAINTKGATLLTMTLPTTAAVGTQIAIQGTAASTGGWRIAQNTAQNIQAGSMTTTIGTSGSLSSSNVNDGIILVCTVANTTWNVIGPVGNWPIV